MNLQKTAIFAALLFALFLYIRHVEMPREQTEAKKDLLVKEVSRTEIREISVKTKKDSYTLKNSDPKKVSTPSVDEFDAEGNPLKEDKEIKSWSLSDPANAVLDAARVNAILAAIVQLKADATIPENEVEKDLGIYGLVTPEAEVEVWYGEGKKKILLGKTNEYVGKRYVKIEGSPELYLVSSGLFEAVDKKKSELRDKTPIEFFDGELETITVNGKDGNVVLHKKGVEDWEITAPLQSEAGALAVNTLIRNVRNLRAEDFVDNPSDLSKYGLTTPTISVTVKTKDKEVPIKLGKSKEKSWFQLGDEKTIYQAAGDPISGIVATVDNYRERKVFKFDYDTVKEVSYEADGKRVVAARDDKGWKTNGNDGDGVFIIQYLKDLSEVEALSFGDSQTIPDTTKFLKKIRVVYKEGDTEKSKTLFVLSKSKAGYLAFVEGTKGTFEITEETAKKITTREESLVKTK